MSCTVIVEFDKNGQVKEECWEIGNAFRGAYAVWAYLEEKYLPEYVPEWMQNTSKSIREQRFPNGFSRLADSFNSNAMKEIWNLYNAKDVEKQDKIILFTTFDRSIILRKDFNRIINAFELKEYKDTSLKEQADIIKQIKEDETVSAIAWNQTSVKENQWLYHTYNEEADEYEGYNYMKYNEHYFLDI